MPTAQIDLSFLDGNNGFTLNGIDSYDFGEEPFDYRNGSVSSAGDINGDGFDDIIIGAHFADPGGNNEAGESYVIFGQASGFNASLDLSTLDGNNGFVLNGINAFDRSGSSVSSAGDINGDGFDDIIIGASGASPGGNFSAGGSYVIFGQASGFGASVDLSTLDGSNGFIMNGIDAGDGNGSSVSSAGDINGDGFDDIIIGAVGASPGGNFDAGESYVVFGQASGFGTSLDLSTLNGSNGFVLSGIDQGDYSGNSVSSAGDINGDGFDDIIIGAVLANPGGNSAAGESYVVFGQASGFSASFDLSALDGSNGFVLNGLNQDDFSGNSVSSAGDINGDGFDDIIIGAPGNVFGDNGAGESYVVFGQASGFAASLDLSALDGSNGFVLIGNVESGSSGNSVSSAGDINGDGFDDIIIGTPGAAFSNGDVGGSSVIFGQASGFAASLDLTALDGSNGFSLNNIDPYDFSGSSVSSAGDINGDGFDDLIIGAHGASPGGNDRAGESYVIFGSALLQAGNTIGTSADETFTGSLFSDTIDGGAGTDTVVLDYAFGDANITQDGDVFTINAGGQIDIVQNVENFEFSDGILTADQLIVPVTLSGGITDDTLIGGNGDDDLAGGDGDDLLEGRFGHDILFGGLGNDTLFGGDGTDTLNGGDGDDFIVGGSSRADLRDLILAGAGADSIDGGYGNDEIFGQDGDDTIAGGFGSDTLQGQNGNDVITGSALSDLVFGNDGDDFVNGGFGHDRINGGAGADRFYHLGIRDHGSDWVQDYNAAEGDILLFGLDTATVDQFRVNFAHTENADGERSGDDTVAEAFVTYQGTVIWALVDGEGQDEIVIKIDGELFDLLG